MHHKLEDISSIIKVHEIQARGLRSDSLQELSGSIVNMRMSPHLPQGFSGGGQQLPLQQSYGGQQGGFVGRRYMGNTF